MPMLPWLFGFLALLGYVARHTIGSVFLSLKSLRRPIRGSVLPNTNGEARSTAPAPTTTLRGRGRGCSKPGFGRRFGLGSGLSFGRRAKSLGPVLPRFHPPNAHHGSAPASPGLRVPGNEDAIPLVDLAGSWASLSSFSDGGASGSGSAQELVDILIARGHAHSESLVDISHPHPYAHPHPHPHLHPHSHSLVDLSHPPDDGFELVSVSVPPSPAAWALAHPALQPTPAATAPTSPAVGSFFPSIQTSNDNDDDNDTTTATTPTPESPVVAAATPAPVLVDLEKPSDDTGDIDIARRPQTPPLQQLPSPPISPPPTARFGQAVFRTMQDDAHLPSSFAVEEGQEGDLERDLEEGGEDLFADPVLVEGEVECTTTAGKTRLGTPGYMG
ncbi:hypothetical protein K438DRAFT_1965430 [Mycena galopus ATCC 62051]|nr:hypothetical protein K438DRAFT_1965430 [Mycena galopus ATCC 62051]